MHNTLKKGFTLLEVTVVIAIITILITISSSMFNSWFISDTIPKAEELDNIFYIATDTYASHKSDSFLFKLEYLKINYKGVTYASKSGVNIVDMSTSSVSSLSSNVALNIVYNDVDFINRTYSIYRKNTAILYIDDTNNIIYLYYCDSSNKCTLYNKIKI